MTPGPSGFKVVCSTTLKVKFIYAFRLRTVFVLRKIRGILVIVSFPPGYPGLRSFMFLSGQPAGLFFMSSSRGGFSAPVSIVHFSELFKQRGFTAPAFVVSFEL
jgi:hypothetical protein